MPIIIENLLGDGDLSVNFYDTLPIFDNFSEVSDDRHYTPAPADWYVVITDVAGSTKAIAEGRYKEVNLVGASTIIAVVNALNGRSVPYVFGGDGATILVHESDMVKIRPVLLATQKMAKDSFNIEIRTGAVPVAKVVESGKKIEVAKYRLSGTAVLAMFRGGGLNYAEKLIKSDPQFALQAATDRKEPPANLNGLSCRWSPIRAKRDVMLSILILALSTPENLAPTYKKILDQIEKILGEGEDSHPVTFAGIAKRGMSLKGFMSELRMLCKDRSLLACIPIVGFACFTFLIMNMFLWLNVRSPFLDSEKYAKEVAEGADFRKFDDMLRMVRDCSIEQSRQIRDYLEGLRANGEVVFGLFSSSHALMTCYVASLTDHVHFIDGSDGGYAMAAKELKQQLNALPKA